VESHLRRGLYELNQLIRNTAPRCFQCSIEMPGASDFDRQFAAGRYAE
jgi:hypothetical protein